MGLLIKIFKNCISRLSAKLKILENSKGPAFWATAFYVKPWIDYRDIWPILSIYGGFFRNIIGIGHFSFEYLVTNCREHLIQSNKIKGVGFIPKKIIFCQKMAYMPIFGHTVFGHNSAMSMPVWLTFFTGAQEIIIHRLVRINLSFISDFQGWSPHEDIMIILNYLNSI